MSKMARARGKSGRRKAESGNTRTARGCVPRLRDQPQRLERTRPLEYPGRGTVPPAAPGPADTGAVRFMVPTRVRNSKVEALHEPWGKSGKRKAESGNALTRLRGRS